MKKLVYCLLFISQTIIAQSWVKLNDIGTIITGTTTSTVPVKDALSFSVNGKIYIIGAVTPTSISPVAMVWEYDPSLDSWQEKASYPGSGNLRLTGFSIGNNIYVGTGYHSSNSTFYYSDFYKYNCNTNSWTPITNFPMVREGATGFSIGAKGYVCCGSASYTLNPTDLWMYDTTANIWQQKANFPGPYRVGAKAFTCLNKAYVGLGYSYGLTTWYADFYKYDPGSNVWSVISNFPGVGRIGAGAVSVNDLGIVFCGNSGMPVLNDCYMYNATSDSWSNYITYGGVARSNLIYGNSGNKLFAGGGNSAGGGGSYSDWWTLQTAIGITENTGINQSISVHQIDENTIMLKRTGEITSPLTINVINCEGKTVLKDVMTEETKTLEINSPGIYFLTHNNKELKPIKFIIR